MQLDQCHADDIHHVFQGVVNEKGFGFTKVAQPLRIAVTGSTMSPSIDTTLDLPGQANTINRINKLLEYLKKTITP